MKTRIRACLLLFILIFSLTSFSAIAQTDVHVITTVAWSPDGETLAIGGRATNEQGAIWLYDGTGTAIDTIYLPDTVYNVHWSRDGARLAARYDAMPGTRLAIWEWKAFNPAAPTVTTETFIGVAETSYRIVWSPSGRYIAVNASAWVYIVDATTGSLIAQLYDAERIGTVGVVDIKWAADEQSIYALYGGRDVNQLLQWEIATAQVAHTVLSGRSFTFPVTLCQRADAQRLAFSVVTGSVFVLSAPDFQVERRLSVLQGDSRIPYVAYLLWLDDESLLGLAYDGTAYLWNTTTGDLIARDALISDRAIVVHGAAISPYGGRLAMATRWQPTSSSATPAYDTYPMHQSLMDGMVRIAVPAPSFDRLNAIVELCARDATTITEKPVIEATLSEFVTAVEMLPDDAIPSACRADLLAVAQALQVAE